MNFMFPWLQRSKKVDQIIWQKTVDFLACVKRRNLPKLDFTKKLFYGVILNMLLFKFEIYENVSLNVLIYKLITLALFSRLFNVMDNLTKVRAS